MGIFQHVDNIATEVIDHQYNNDEFRTSLIEVVSTILQKLEAGIYKNTLDVVRNDTEISKIVDLVKKRTGIKLNFTRDEKLVTNNPGNACILSFTNNIFNPMLKPGVKSQYFDLDIMQAGRGFEESMDKQIRSMQTTPCSVDTKNGRVSGGYADLSFTIVVDFLGLYKIYKLTAAEIAAAIIHEVGHVFTYLHFNNKLTIINLAAYNIYSRGKIEDKDKKFSVVYKELKTIDGSVTEKQVEDMIKGNSITASLAYFDFITRNTSFQNLLVGLDPKNHGYNTETVADQFAVRMGFGDSIFGAVSKTANRKTPEWLTFLWYCILFKVFITLYLLTFAIIFGLIGLGFVVPLSASTITIMAIILPFFTIAENISNSGNTYKYKKERLQKIINDAVDSIKNVEDKQFKETAIENIKVMKSIVNSLPTEHGMIAKIALMVNKSARTKTSYAAQQELLERIASNDLFVKAVELELQSKGK